MPKIKEKPQAVATLDELQAVAEEYAKVKEEFDKLSERKTTLSDTIKATLKDTDLGTQTPEGHFTTKFPNGGSVLVERRVRYDDKTNETVPFLKSKGLGQVIIETFDRDKLNAAIKLGEFSAEELEKHFVKAESFATKVAF